MFNAKVKSVIRARFARPYVYLCCLIILLLLGRRNAQEGRVGANGVKEASTMGWKGLEEDILGRILYQANGRGVEMEAKHCRGYESILLLRLPLSFVYSMTVEFAPVRSGAALGQVANAEQVY